MNKKKKVTKERTAAPAKKRGAKPKRKSEKPRPGKARPVKQTKKLRSGGPKAPRRKPIGTPVAERIARMKKSGEKTERARGAKSAAKPTLEVIPLGGYSEVGRNSVAIRLTGENKRGTYDDVFILDMGLAIDKYIEYTEREEYDNVKVSGKKLIEIGAAPDVNLLGDLRRNVRAILVTHAHLDHIMGIPYLANRFKAPIYATPFTAAILDTITTGEKMPLNEDVLVKKAGDHWKLTNEVEAEFIHVTHSTPQTVMIALHTPAGTVVYANDFKMDEHPTKGDRTDTKRLKELRGAKLLILDSLYATKDEKVPSENYARSMLFNVLDKEYTKNKIVVATTFASHIYRLQTLIEVAKRLNRKPVFLGRSMAKYITAAEELKIADFSEAEVVPFGSKVRAALKRIRHPEDCLFICTGNQGEPKAALSKIVHGGWLPFEEDDIVVFSCIAIPVEPNLTYRAELEEFMERKGLEVMRDIHVSGHGSLEDHRRMLKLLKPQNVIPSHGTPEALSSLKKMAMKDLQYKTEQVHILKNGERLRL